MKLKKSLLLIGTILITALVIFNACQKEINNSAQSSDISSAKANSLTAPVIECVGSSIAHINIRVTGTGQLGAPAGFSIQWMTAEDYAKYGWSVPDSTMNDTCSTACLCKASFSGVPGCSNFNIASGQSVTIQIGQNPFDECGASSICANMPLKLGTEYVFRVFAHNDPTSKYGKSPFTANLTCSTLPIACTYTLDFWKKHGPEGCVSGSNANVWPLVVQKHGLALGNITYTEDQLCSILNTSPMGNGLLTSGRQLIVAKLNIANGSDPSAVQAYIDSTDAFIGNYIIPPVGSDYVPASSASTYVHALSDYNSGITGPGQCPESEHE